MAVTYINRNRCPKPYSILLRDVARCYPRAISDSVCDSPIIYNVLFTNVIYLYIKKTMKDLKKFIATTIREYLNENISLQIDDIYIKYETSDKRAYADIEKTSNDTWHISLIESRRKGGGTELMNRIISDAKIQGIKKITLTTTEQIGWGFFDNFGFVEVGDNNDPFDFPMILYV